MRDLVQSRSVVAVLVGLYVLSLLGAIPVPTISLSDSSSAGAAHASYCSCVSCSPDSCCCAMMQGDSDDEGGVAMFGYRCQPTLTWFLAVMPPVVPHVEALAAVEPWRLATSEPAHASADDRSIGVPTPPPKRAA